MGTVRRPPNRREVAAAAVGGPAGAAILGAVVRVGSGPAGLDRFGTLVGGSGPVAAWGTLALSGLVLALGFGAFLAATANPFVDLLFGLTRRSDPLRRVLLPVVTGPAYPVSALVLGLAYGLAVGVVVGAVAMPAWIRATGGSAAVPAVDPVALAGWVLYGGVVGLVYGVLTEKK